MPYPLNNFHVRESERPETPEFIPRLKVPEALFSQASSKGALIAVALFVSAVGAGVILSMPGKMYVSPNGPVQSSNVLSEGVKSASDLAAFIRGVAVGIAPDLKYNYAAAGRTRDAGAGEVAAPAPGARGIYSEVVGEYNRIRDSRSHREMGASALSAESALYVLESIARWVYRSVSDTPGDFQDDGPLPELVVVSPESAVTPAEVLGLGTPEEPVAATSSPSSPVRPSIESAHTQTAAAERVIERTPPVVNVIGISEAELSVRLQQLDNKFASKLADITATNNQQITDTYHVVSQTNKIDNLSGIVIDDSTLSGVRISGASTFSGTTISGTTGTFSGSVTIGDSITVSGSSISTVASSLNIDTDTFVVDSVNNRVGIGTTSPYAKLSVAGEVVAGSFTATSTATTTLAGQLLVTRVPTVAHTFSAWAVNAADAYPLAASLIVNPASAPADTNLLALSVAGNAKFIVDAEGDVLANSVTAVGGTTLSTTTASTFSVENNSTFGDATTTDKTYFNSRIGTSLIPTIDNLLDIGDTANGLAWRTGIFGTSVGIGTTSPFAKLSVAGIGSFDDYVRASYFISTSTIASTFAGAITSTATGANTFPYASTTALTVSGVGYFGTASSTNLTVSSLTTSRVPFVTTGGALTDSSLLTFDGTRLNTSYASTTAFTVSGSAYFATSDGNVGIGTTSPWATLAVELGTVPGFVVGNQGSSTPAFYIAGVNGDGGVGVNTVGGVGRRLDVLDAANPQLRLSQSSTTASVYTDFQVAAATGDLSVSLYPSTSANDIFLYQPGGTIGANLWVCQGSACPSLTIANGGNVIAENAYYFGNGYKLDQVAGTTTEIGVYNTAGTAVIIFDEY